MARIRLHLPEPFHFSTIIPVRITDLNYGGHVGNDTILSIIHEARVQFLLSIGYTEMKMEGVSLIMSDAAIEFKAESFHGDSIQVWVKAADFTRAGFDLYYKLLKLEGSKAVAFAKTGMVCYNYDSSKVVALPEEARGRLVSS